MYSYFFPNSVSKSQPLTGFGCGFRAGSRLPIFRHAHTIKRHCDIKHKHYGHWSQHVKNLSG